MSSAIRSFSDKDVACLYVVKSIRGILKVESERTSCRLLGSALFQCAAGETPTSASVLALVLRYLGATLKGERAARKTAGNALRLET